MRFVGGGVNGTYLSGLKMQAITATTEVFAAIAYASGTPELFEWCWDNNVKLTYWGRYDDSAPVSVSILEEFLSRASANYVCKLVPDIFHAKVIWWKGFGVYIGSANLTNSAWYGNIEGGIFLDDEELAEGIERELENFFAVVDENSHPLTNEIVSELSELQKIRQKLKKSEQAATENFRKARQIPPKAGLTVIVAKQREDKAREEFLKEWNATLQTLRDIAKKVSEPKSRPAWVGADVPSGAQADQFLHAYYYNHVMEGNTSRHEDFFARNRKNPEFALKKAMAWWGSCKSAPSGEDVTLHQWAPLLRSLLAKGKLLGLTEREFVKLCSMVHALRDHSLRVKHTAFGSKVPLPTMDREQRIHLLGTWLYRWQSEGEKSVLQTIDYVLHGGPRDKTPRRIWSSISDSTWRIPHLGISSVGEIVGWGMPNDFPPRNGRTSKALRALGFSVKVFSD